MEKEKEKKITLDIEDIMSTVKCPVCGLKLKDCTKH